MRSATLVAVLALAATSASAQAMNWGITGGATLGTPDDFYSVAAASTIGGWSVGAAIGDRSASRTLGLRVDLAYSNLHNPTAHVYPPGMAVDPDAYSTQYETIGASADLLWNVLGPRRTTGPYLLGGLGWYAVKTRTEFPGSPQPTDITWTGALSYNGGLGFRFSRYFVEARAIAYDNVPTPLFGYGRTRIYSFPITAGFWF
jgi:hypothetical protein